jgi:hypothetical protein
MSSSPGVARDRVMKSARVEIAERFLGRSPSILGHRASSTAFAVGRCRVLKATGLRDRGAVWFGRFARPAGWHPLYRPAARDPSH